MLSTVIDNVVKGEENKVLKLYSSSTTTNGRVLGIEGKEMLNFGNCSYLGLETDKRLIEESVKATINHGTQTSCSRTYVTNGLYAELEELLEELFGGYVIVFPRTTSAHLSIVPILTNSEDILLIDHQAHFSMKEAIQLTSVPSDHKIICRHNDIADIERKINQFPDRKIWYFIDGVYSMFGDYCHIDQIQALIDKYPNFNVYADDAHGVGVFGENGKGYVLDKTSLHDRLILTTTLGKGFGSGGGVTQ